MGFQTGTGDKRAYCNFLYKNYFLYNLKTFLSGILGEIFKIFVDLSLKPKYEHDINLKNCIVKSVFKQKPYFKKLQTKYTLKIIFAILAYSIFLTMPRIISY